VKGCVTVYVCLVSLAAPWNCQESTLYDKREVLYTSWLVIAPHSSCLASRGERLSTEKFDIPSFSGKSCPLNTEMLLNSWRWWFNFGVIVGVVIAGTGDYIRCIVFRKLTIEIWTRECPTKFTRRGCMDNWICFMYQTTSEFRWQSLNNFWKIIFFLMHTIRAVVVEVHFIRCITGPPEILLGAFFGPLALHAKTYNSTYKGPLWLIKPINCWKRQLRHCVQYIIPIPTNCSISVTEIPAP